ncbi:MAG TPA: VPDSG-CTERM sorting domain-containing protein [Pyrinomonadaceae bacterium]|nr:VPDSG-CTERM sorting domain-containing protein [Pyrinomonadaceae bacterium]
MKIRNASKIATVATCLLLSGGASQAGTILLGVFKYHPPLSSISQEASYVNTFVDMANGVIALDPYTSDGKWYDLINNPAPLLPKAITSGATTAYNWTSPVNFGAGSGFNYVLAEFASQWGNIDVVYYSTDGAFSIPSNVAGCDGIKHYSAFRTTEALTAASAVPDGGATIVFLGFAMLGLLALNRQRQPSFV